MRNWNPPLSTFSPVDVDFRWHLMDFPEKNPRIKIRQENLWNIFFLIVHGFFCLILYHPGFYSSLSDKKQRNGGISKISAILVKFVKNACENDFYFINSIFLVRFLQNLPISHFFMKCCHFFVFYHSESCKNQDDRELNKRKHGLSRKIYFIDFLVLFWFADFFLENPSNVT